MLPSVTSGFDPCLHVRANEKRRPLLDYWAPGDDSTLNAIDVLDGTARPTYLEPLPRGSADERSFRRRVVRLISLDKDPTAAIDLLSRHYRVERPLLRMGLPKGTKRALGCYVQRDKTIYISREEFLYDPYVLIHEFYHHLRNVSGKHRGTERHARDFALEFLREN